MDTDTLRIVLFVLGVFFVAGIYFWDRRKHVDGRFYAKQQKRRNKRKKHSVFDQEVHRQVSGAESLEADEQTEMPNTPETPELSGVAASNEAAESFEPQTVAEPGALFDNVDNAEIKTDNLHFSADPVFQADDLKKPAEDFQLTGQADEWVEDKLSFSSNSAFEAFEAGADLPTKILQINLVARNNEISGQMIMDLTRELNLELGEFNIFHRMDKATGKSVFSMANIVEPGSFDKNNMQDFRTPGLTLFSQLPAPIDCLNVYSEMIDTAKRISYILGADMQDSSRSIMTAQSIEHEREEVVAYRHKLQMAMQS